LVAAVGSRSFQLGDAGGMHPAFRQQLLREPDVPPRPRALLSARAEAHDEGPLVARPTLAVDPAVAQRLVERLGVGEAGRMLSALLGQGEPDASGGVMITKPGSPCSVIGNGQVGQ